MRDNSKSDNQEPVSSSSLVPNEYLADARKQKGIEERDAADALKISVVRLRSIEAGEYSVFPSETYVRGHLRKYSRFLGVDEEMVVNAYNGAHPPTFDFVNPENNAKEKKSPSVASSKRSRKFIFLTLMLVGLWIAAYSFFAQSPNGFSAIFSSSSSTLSPLDEADAPLKSIEVIESPDADEVFTRLQDEVVTEESALSGSESNASLAISELAESLNVDVPDDSSDVSLDSNAESEQGVKAADENLSALTSEQQLSTLPMSDLLIEPNMVVSKVTAAELVKSISSADATAADEAVEPDAHVLKFAFVNPCWVKVTDAAGSVIFVGLKASNSTLSLSGEAPFKIIFGNVEGTSLVYNDAPVVLEPQANGRPLRLVVGQ
ncbi:MAG: cytoskeleton protein RodZ [Cellvibrionaceae bacterium]|jgi:cytoskeleton protein RodZ